MAKRLKKILKQWRLQRNRSEDNSFQNYAGTFNILAELEDGLNRDARKLLNLLHYTKSSGVPYSAEEFSSGYHSIQINGKSFTGQRNPGERLSSIDYDFDGKVVIDIGCNQGGMLYEITDKILHGIGIDYDSRMINAANRHKSKIQTSNLDFYTFDLENENLDLIVNFIPGESLTVDIVFLLSVCMWIPNWKAVIDKAKSISDTLLFETNGSQNQQTNQIKYLNTLYNEVILVTGSSPDDPKQKNRQLYLCNQKR